MILQLNRMISNWERSGQGDGGYLSAEFDYENIDDLDDDELEFGSLRNRPQGALDLRKTLLTLNHIFYISGKCWILMTCSALLCND